MKRIAIVGAGIGGLTAAIALARQNVECVVFERHATLPDDATGIEISPNAAAELHALGVAFEDDAVRPHGREIRRWRDNSTLARTDLSRYAAPYYTVRRGALIAALKSASPVRFGRRCVAIRNDPAGVVLGFDDGTITRADAVVGADGLHSAVRGVFSRELPRYSGFVASHTVMPMDAARPLAAPDRVLTWLGPKRHCLAYPIDGGRRLTLVVVEPQATPTAQNPPRDSLTNFLGWHPAVRGLLGLAGRLHRRALYDRPPLQHWQHHRAVLIGDAAHPMLPFLAQGAAQAIEDAATLARCLTAPDPFARYEELRRPRLARIAEATRAALRTFHFPDGEDQRRRDRAMAASPPDALDWLYAHRPG
ncbi:NAD(P)-binding protein [Actinoplanes sp. TBRC 11911]|uniref:FAD-dependent monooxygenase n=1 Tax=Actinoplanes sp. TBRC 11911 TaxID=2729386 RepID=UPI00145E7DFE|nr:FAD-dependent monooxygenase [Actinoplanes sp. TBRC 11911]NMO52436.1 NAD(P)-binding protein [Actinoplanes sp. TBRC 11911]